MGYYFIKNCKLINHFCFDQGYHLSLPLMSSGAAIFVMGPAGSGKVKHSDIKRRLFNTNFFTDYTLLFFDAILFVSQ